MKLRHVAVPVSISDFPLSGVSAFSLSITDHELYLSIGVDNFTVDIVRLNRDV